MSPVPPWLAPIQALIGEVVRTPLDRSSGTFRPETNRYGCKLVEMVSDTPFHSAREALGIYNRQYWMRLFSLSQEQYPLTARIVGLFELNKVTLRYFERFPPRGLGSRSGDLGAAMDGFLAFLSSSVTVEEVPHVPREALLQAAQIDEAWRSLGAGRDHNAWRPDAHLAARLASAHLVRSDGVRWIQQNWPLLALRRRLSGIVGESPFALPPRGDTVEAFALVRTGGAIVELPLTRIECRLLQLLESRTLGHALAVLEAEEGASDQLAATIRQWLGRTVQLGFWCDARFD